MSFFSPGAGRGYLWQGLAEGLKNTLGIRNKENELARKEKLLNTQYDLMLRNTQERYDLMKELEKMKEESKNQLEQVRNIYKDKNSRIDAYNTYIKMYDLLTDLDNKYNLLGLNPKYSEEREGIINIINSFARENGLDIDENMQLKSIPKQKTITNPVSNKGSQNKSDNEVKKSTTTFRF